jgi:hypothetical protein
MSTGYDFDATEFAELLLRKFYPEKTDRESGVLRDYLRVHLHEFDRISFSVRIGDGLPPDPAHLPGIQANTARFTKKRMDFLAWAGAQPVIGEVKERVTPSALGQIQTYRHLFREEFPDAPEPRLVVVGRTSDDDTLRALHAYGVDVYLYEGGAAP